MKRVFLISLALSVLTATAACAADVAEKVPSVAEEHKASLEKSTNVGTGWLPAQHDGIAPEDYPKDTPILVYSENDELCREVEQFLLDNNTLQETKKPASVAWYSSFEDKAGDRLTFVKWLTRNDDTKEEKNIWAYAFARFDIDNDGVEEVVQREFHHSSRAVLEHDINILDSRYTFEDIRSGLHLVPRDESRTKKYPEGEDWTISESGLEFIKLQHTDTYQKIESNNLSHRKARQPHLPSVGNSYHFALIPFLFDGQAFVLATDWKTPSKRNVVFKASAGGGGHICYFAEPENINLMLNDYFRDTKSVGEE